MFKHSTYYFTIGLIQTSLLSLLGISVGWTESAVAADYLSYGGSTIAVSELDDLAKTGQESLTIRAFRMTQLEETPQQIQEQLNRPISIDPTDTLVDLTEHEKRWLDDFVGNVSDEQLQTALQRADAQVEDEITMIDFIKAFPQETVVVKNVVDFLFKSPTLQSEAPSQQKQKRIRISQESQAQLGDFDANVLGFIDAIQTDQTAAGYYGYNWRHDASFSGGLELISNTSHLFLVDAADGLSLFVVHDRPRDSGWGRASMQVDLLSDDADLLVMDDSPRHERYLKQDSSFTISHAWSACCTDGFALGALENDWQAFLQFTKTPTGLYSWRAFSGSDETPVDLELVVSQRVRLDIVDVPEPSTLIGLMVFGAVGLLTRRR